MIKGIGIDIIELDRIQHSLRKSDRFIKRILTKDEQKAFLSLQKEYRQVEYAAGRFAAKEAFAKAVGSGIGSLSFQDIEIMQKTNGKPSLQAIGYESEHVFLSISHSKTYAVAQVIIEEKRI
ncbi:MAG TPA: holo-ACP synthase [Pseudogracilibacillus sp.]|nr:holo-ACP synthase [Pseudogracilibacillus sp.]